MKSNIIALCFFLFTQTYSQTNSPSNNQETIKTHLETYFKNDREIIHVQFNKNSYVNKEDIAYKGYVLSKNNYTPHANTTNVQLVIYNEEQQIILKQLLYTTKGTFAGGVHLNDKFKAGKYYFKFSTNWMNNFKEDDTFTQTIEIIDTKDPYNIKSGEPNWETAEITFSPEAGIIIADVTNQIGVTIKDCNKMGIEVKDGQILDSKSNEIARFKTNKMGHGVFYLNPDLNEKYTLKINSDKLSISKALPSIQATGIAIIYNNYLKNNKIAIGIKTNEKGLELNQNKKFILLIQQDSNFIQHQISFEKEEKERVILIDKKLLSNGVNSIRLIDESLNEITERLVYNDAAPKPTTTFEAKVTTNDSIQLIGKTDLKRAQLSINVLPKNNVCLYQKRSILGTFYLNAYLEYPVIDNYSYFDPENKDKKQDMELLLLNQKRSKYSWENIKTNPPTINYTFDKGVTISGKVEKEIKPNSKFRISLISLKDKVFDETPINEKNDFRFENYYAKDSTVFLLQMINEKNMSIKTNMEARVYRNEIPNKFPLQIENSCPKEVKKNTPFVFTQPKSENNTINLGEIVIKNKFKKEIFTHKKEMSMNASAYKIGDNEFGNILDFISMHGYRTGVDPEENNVFIRSNRSANFGENPRPPAVFIDNNIVFDLNLLFDINLQDVDEIYIDRSGDSNISMNSDGTIKIFLKPNSIKDDYFNPKYTSLIVTKGFSENIVFKNSAFETQQEFYKFGTLNWTPNIIINENPSFTVKFPRGNQQDIQVYMEGIGDDGQLISEMKTISVSNP